MAKWIRYDERSKTQKFRCPHCGRVCRSHSQTSVRTYCDYLFCPYCGKEVEPDSMEDKA